MIEGGSAGGNRLICPSGGEEWVFVSDMFPSTSPVAEKRASVSQVRSVFEGGRPLAQRQGPCPDPITSLEHDPMYASRFQGQDILFHFYCEYLTPRNISAREKKNYKKKMQN